MFTELIFRGRDALGAQIHFSRRPMMRGVVHHEHHEFQTGHIAVSAAVGFRQLRRRELRYYANRRIEGLPDKRNDVFLIHRRRLSGIGAIAGEWGPSMYV